MDNESAVNEETTAFLLSCEPYFQMDEELGGCGGGHEEKMRTQGDFEEEMARV